MENQDKTISHSEIIQTKNGYAIQTIKYENEEDEFPIEIAFKKEIQENFKYFNIFWFDPNKTHDFDYFKSFFKNTKFFKGTEIEKTIKFFDNESTLEEWIVITPGSKSEELISKIQQKDIIKAFFIFCFKPELYEELPKKYDKIKFISKDPIILLQKILELNKDYLIPNFNYYQNINKIEYDFDLDINNLQSHSKYALQSIIREKNEFYGAIEKDKNKYNIFCMKTLKYLKEEKTFEDFEETIKNENEVFYSYVDNIKFKDKDRLKKIIKFVTNITLISLYFSKYKYLYNLFTYNEIKEILSEEIKPKNYIDLYNDSVFQISENLAQKLLKNESILLETNLLKQIQLFSILFTYFGLARHRKKEFIDFYQIINFYRDIDFCLKLLIFYFYLIFNDRKNKFINDLYNAFNLSDFRITRIFMEYANNELKDLKFSLNQKDQKSLDDSLTIKDFIVIGDNNFHNKIKTIEKNIKINSIEYLTFNEISNYIITKNFDDGHNEDIDSKVTFWYYLIMDIDEFKKNYGKICLLAAELGISFMVILYVENEEKIFINKMIIKITLVPVILVYCPEDIIKYLSKKMKFNFLENIKQILENDPDFIDFHKANIPKINFNINNNEDYQDGCFELGETFDVNIIKNKIVRKWNDNILDISAIFYYLYLTYCDNNALELFYKFCGLYYGLTIDPENIYLEVSGMKRILYMYCREELESQKSLYRMLNNDLRTRNPAKIYRYLDLIAFINKLIINGEIANYKGKVYRATKLDEQMIEKLEIGSIMVNTTFWSTSKDIAIAERFLKNQNWRNAFIICDTLKNNVDIDFENLNYFGEKEVLFLPFTEFKVEKIIKEEKYGRKIYYIELTEIGSKNSVNFQNMQIINVNDVNYMNFYDKINEKKKKEEEEKKMKENQEKEKEIKLKEEPEEIRKKEIKEDDIIKNFRLAFNFSKDDYNTEYIQNLLDLTNKDFKEAMLIHIENENAKLEINKEKVKDNNNLNLLVQDFRKIYNLSLEDYPDDLIKNALVKKEGNFDNAFEELMSFIQ